MSQKMMIALFLVREKGGKEVTVPVGFSVDSTLIPTDLKPLEVHYDNYVKITVKGHQPFTAMIISVGEDSKDLSAGYKTFLKKTNTPKPPNLPTKISHWLSLANADIKKSNEFSVKPSSRADFNCFLKYVENSIKPVSVVCSPEVVVLDEISNPPSTSSSFRNSNFEDTDDKKALKVMINHTREKIKKLKEMTDALALPELQKNYFLELATIQNNMINIFVNLEQLKYPVVQTPVTGKVETKAKDVALGKDLRIIPEEDQTKERAGGITCVEGLLPVKTGKYKKFLKSLPRNVSDREPNAVITNFVKFCFPNHWLTGVTVAGKGNNKSLLSVWNHTEPLNQPVSGIYDERLGKSRFDALIDHTMRKCGRKSYDSHTVGYLGNQVCKTMYYQRTRICVKKGPSSSSGEKDTTESETHDSLDYSQMDDDDNDEDIENEDEDDDSDSQKSENGSETETDQDVITSKKKDKEPDNLLDRNSKIYEKGSGFCDGYSKKSPRANIRKSPDKEEKKSSGAHVAKEGSDKEVSDKEESDKEESDKEEANKDGSDKDGSDKEDGKSHKASQKVKSNDDGADLFDDDDDEFLKSMYTLDHEMATNDNLFDEGIVENVNQTTSTPVKKPCTMPFPGVSPVQYLLSTSNQSAKSKSGFNEQQSKTSSDSGISSLGATGIDLKSTTQTQVEKASESTPKVISKNKEATQNKEDNPAGKPIEKGTKRKTSVISDNEAKKLQKIVIAENTETDQPSASKADLSGKASTSLEPQIDQPSPSIPHEALAFLSNPDNQKFLATLMAQMAKK